MEIPYVVNGVSANTLFWLINTNKKDFRKCIAETCSADIPHDEGDFRRLMNVYYVSNWNFRDIQYAEKVASSLKLDKVSKFLEKFYLLKEMYDAKMYQDLYDALQSI